MRYRVTLEGVEREIDVEMTPAGATGKLRVAAVRLDGRDVAIDAQPIPGGVSLRVGDRVYDVLVGGDPEAMDLAAGSLRASARVESERRRRRDRKRQAGGGGANEVRAAMPGRIVSLLVAEGDTLEANAPVVVIEAMKMENELRSPRAGVVAAVVVSEGDTVEAGTVLVRLAPTDS